MPNNPVDSLEGLGRLLREAGVSADRAEVIVREQLATWREESGVCRKDLRNMEMAVLDGLRDLSASQSAVLESLNRIAQTVQDGCEAQADANARRLRRMAWWSVLLVVLHGLAVIAMIELSGHRIVPGGLPSKTGEADSHTNRQNTALCPQKPVYLVSKGNPGASRG